MPYEVGVAGPGKVHRVHRARNTEPLLRLPARRLEEEFLQLRLPVSSIGAQIREIRREIGISCNPVVHTEIDAAIQRCGTSSSELVRKFGECFSARVTQNQIKGFQAVSG